MAFGIAKKLAEMVQGTIRPIGAIHHAKCPQCGTTQGKSRLVKKGVRRKRICGKCNYILESRVITEVQSGS